MLIAEGRVQRSQLAGKVAIVTGAGGGIGLEAARALVWLGARVIVAEVDRARGTRAQASLRREFGTQCTYFCRTDVSDERSVKRLHSFVTRTLGRTHIIINNATIAVVGSVHEVSTRLWDRSYGVNLRGPVLMLKHFLPEMLEANEGIIAFVPSSGAAPYLGAYEVFKTAQVELGNTLSAELEKTGVISYSIGPGIVKTDTADAAIRAIAPLYGMTVDEFYAMNSALLLSSEAAGAGFAASVALAERYRGTEIGSIQALRDAAIDPSRDSAGVVNAAGASSTAHVPDAQREGLLRAASAVRTTFAEQVAGWYKRSVFERQWVLRDFKKSVGDTPETLADTLRAMEVAIAAGHITLEAHQEALNKLSVYYRHLVELMRGYEKSADRAKEQEAIMSGWLEEIRDVERLLHNLN